MPRQKSRPLSVHGRGAGGDLRAVQSKGKKVSKSIKRINYAYKTLVIVSVAKWRVVQLPGELQRQVTAEADAKDIAQ
jgi:hypothetical protein